MVQDIEIPVERTAEFLRWYLRRVRMTPVWLCPLRAPRPLGDLADGARPGRCTRYGPATTYVNAGFWGMVPIAPGRADGDVNREVERVVGRPRRSQVAVLRRVLRRGGVLGRLRRRDLPGLKQRYDPDGRLLDLYDKAVGRR